MMKTDKGPFNSSRSTIIFFILIANIVILGCLNNVEEKSLNERAVKLDKIIICPVCPGETIDQSQVKVAQQMRAIVRTMLTQGASDTEVIDFFVDRYGISIIGDPPKQGISLIAWIVPLVVLIVGGLTLLLVVKAMGKPNLTRLPKTRTTVDSSIKPYLKEVDTEFDSINQTSIDD